MKLTFIVGHLCKERNILTYELALMLSSYGVEVSVITGFPSLRIDQETREYYINHQTEQLLDNLIVYRVGSKKGEGNNLFIRAIKYLNLIKAIYKKAKTIKTDVFYIYSTPPFLGYLGAKLTKIAPTLYNVQDLFPDTLMHTKKLSEKNILIKYLRYKERNTYLSNSRIVTISNGIKQVISNRGCPSNKLDVIYNWADNNSLHHIDRKDNKLMDELNIDKSKFIISYAGDIGLFQDFDIIIASAKRLKIVNPDILFLIIGDGSYKKQLDKQIEDEHIDNIKLLPMQSVERLSEIYSIGDMELVSIKSGVAKMSFPSKISTILMTGNPILAVVDKDSEISNIIDNNELGIAFTNNDVDGLTTKIQYYYNHQNELYTFRKNAREFALDNYSKEKQTQKYYQILQELVNTNSK